MSKANLTNAEDFPVQRLVIFAPRVFNGGGAVLLGELLASLRQRSDIQSKFFLDHRFLKRLSLTMPKEADWVRTRSVELPSGIQSYIVSEQKLARYLNQNSGAKVLFFSNLGPIFLSTKFRRQCVVFVQNRFVLESSFQFAFPWFRQIRLIVERILFNWASRRVGGFVVQSESMQNCIKKAGHQQAVLIQPFVDNLGYQTGQENSSDVDFVYVASPDPHKNHTVLLNAWALLASEGHHPSLRITVPEIEPLNIWKAAIDINKQLGCRISRVDQRSDEYQSRAMMYAGARALIFPSLLESHGLPLVEARALGLGVVAAELDYVRDSVSPDQTFDPRSAVSLARAVKRFLGLETTPPAPVDGEEFVNQLISFYGTLK